ncbi:secretion protein HlyD, partial [filamentous cyanobacterium CCP5]
NQSRLRRLAPLVEKGALAEEYIFGVEATLRESQRALRENQGRLQQTQAQLDQLQAELSQHQSEAQRVEIAAQQQLQRLEIEYGNLQAQIAETSTLLQAAKSQLDRTYIHAPVAGIVSSLNINNIGEVAQPGQTLIEIAPTNARLVMSGQLSSRETGLVSAGMPVQLKLDAFPYQTYGILPGKVLSVSPDSKTTSNNEVVYDVEIALERDYVIHEGQVVPLKVGQTGRAEIVTQQKRVIDILIDPVRQLKTGGINL